MSPIKNIPSNTKAARKESHLKRDQQKQVHFSLENLPVSLSSFIGRKHEIDKVKQLVLAHRLVTLTGAGGSGKTRLALQAVQELAGDFKQDIWFVDLASLNEATLIPGKITSTLKLREKHGLSAMDLSANYLSKRKALLILDNCEHLVAACAVITESLLQKCPHLHILTTSRELLGISIEVIWVVPPLTLPDPSPSRKPINPRDALIRVQESESAQLFIERASAKNSEFTLTSDNCNAVAEICNRLDGMPLAIELAAAQVRSMSVQEIARHLDQRFQFLTSGSRNAPTRQRTLMAAIDWSYALLPAHEQSLLQRLSIFADGTTLEAVEAICVDGEIKSAEVLETISHLVDKSLVVANKLERGEARYRLLETIRQYAFEKLTESQESVAIQNKYLEYFVQFAEAGDQMIKGPKQGVWYERLEVEWNNIRTALKWALESKNIEAGLRLSSNMVYFWFVHGHVMEDAGWLGKFLDQKLDVPFAVEAWALLYQGVIVRTISKDADNTSELLYEKSLRLFRELGDPIGMAWVLNMMGLIALEKNELAKAEKLLGESLALRKELGDPWSIAQTLQNFPTLACKKNDLKRAQEYAEETVYWFEKAGDQRGIARSLIDFADIARLKGDTARAVELLEQALSPLIQLGDKGTIMLILENLTVLALEQHKYVRGAILAGATETLHEEMRTYRHGIENDNYQEAMETIQGKLGEENFKQAFEKGRRIPLEQILDRVMQNASLSEIKAIDTAEEQVWHQLSSRERDVIQLLAQGHSNLEISQKLYLSEKTVRNHISNIYRKLQVTNRGKAILMARKLFLNSEE